jgi:alkanesulfonate monooxygenase SsuD/methylene tetrahydromethanopterin reductase-like flavin-dependent oxidoreductase (luciferase family)
MKLGAFMMPSHPPERPLLDGYAWDLAQLERLDRMGFDEAWIGEHFTAPWEPNPAPDLLIAQALLRTERIKLAPGAHLLPYHHPIELAHRVAFLDQLARGRYMFGVGISALPSDLALYGVDAAAGENRRMTLESLEIMLSLWTKGATSYDGRYWRVRPPETQFPFLRLHLTPYQKPHPPIGIAGMSPGSETLKIAGERGFMPLSLSLNLAHIASHWRAVEEGAARSGRTPDRRDWRLVKEVYVAPTDAQARERALGGAMGRCWREYLLPFFLGSGMIEHFKVRPSEPDSAIDVEYLVENSWLVGSPRTVVARLDRLYRETGGFGGLLCMIYDYGAEEAHWNQSLELLTREVWPEFARR